MNVALDMILSVGIVGVLILNIVSANASLSNDGFKTSYEITQQENAAEVASWFNYDFYKIGYHASSGLLLADTNKITFVGDIDNNGVADTIQYFTSVSPNGNTSYKGLSRKMNSGGKVTANLGVTQFNLTYYDTAGKKIVFPTPTDPASLLKVCAIKIQLSMISLYAPIDSTLDSAPVGVYWEKTYSPKNLRVLK